MKQILLLLFLLTAKQSCAQKAALLITNKETLKERIIKENKRIRVTKVTGEKFQGRFAIIDENSIALDGVEIHLSEIKRIKRHPLFNTIFIKSNLVHIGSLGLFFGLLGAGLGSSTGNGANINPEYYVMGGVVILAAGIYGALKEPNLNKGYNTNKKWRFSIHNGLNDENQATSIIDQL